MRLFAERGAAAVTVRDVAAASGVSAPLVIHHYKSKDGLKTAVDDYALGVVEQMFALAAELEPAQLHVAAMASPLAELLEREPDVTTYLRRLLVDGGPPAETLFRRLYETAVAAFTALENSGLVRRGPDPALQAAFLLVNDLGAVILREQLREVVGIDPLAGEGIVRWTKTILDVYGKAVFLDTRSTQPRKAKR